MRQTLRVTGEVLLTVGVITLLFVGYLLWGSGMRTAAAQRQFTSELNQQWGRHASQPKLAGGTAAIDITPERFTASTGQPFAFITIPAFGANWKFTLIQGTALAQLNLSPGHVPGTQWPGQVGNFAVAGHRVTSGNPFWSLPSLRSGDLVHIQTQLNDYTYRVTSKKMVLPADTAVLDAVPGHPGAQPTARFITLITCDPAWTGTHRVIVTGVLVAASPR
jgi:sortase A